jgi:hypothetical protein
MIKNFMEIKGVIMVSDDDKDTKADVIEDLFFEFLEEYDFKFFGITNIDVEE